MTHPITHAATTNVTHHSFGELDVRVILDAEGDPWFVVPDVCRALGHTNPTVAVARLEEGDRNTLNTGQTGRGNPNVNVVSEAGLYELIMTSRVEGAKPFKRWVTHDVLPQIRKTGAYAAPGPTLAALNDPATLRSLLSDYAGRVERLEAKTTEDAPKVEVHDRIMASGDTVGFRECCKLVFAATGANEREVRSLMLNRGWIQRLGGRQAPAHVGQSRGYVTSIEREFSDGEGGRRVKPELRITQKGLGHAIKLLLASET